MIDATTGMDFKGISFRGKQGNLIYGYIFRINPFI